MRFVYSLIRFVPDPASGEFINIGAIAGSDFARDWDLRMVENLRRARFLDVRGVLSSVLAHVDSVSREIDMHMWSMDEYMDSPLVVSEAWLTDLWQDSRRVIQFSKPTPIVSDTAASALDLVFEHLIAGDSPKRERAKDRRVALSATRNAFRQVGLHNTRYLQEGVNVVAGDYGDKFDFVVLNGQAVQLSQAWSFQRRDQAQLEEEVLAWGWNVERLRKGGGVISLTRGETISVPSDIAVDAIVVPPLGEQSMRTYNLGLQVFKDIHVTSVTYDHASEVAERAVHLLGDHGVPTNLRLEPPAN